MVLRSNDAVADRTPSYCGTGKTVYESILRLTLEKKTLGKPGVFFLF